MLEHLKESLCGDHAITHPPLEKLARYYDHLLEEILRQVYGWHNEVLGLEKLMT